MNVIYMMEKMLNADVANHYYTVGMGSANYVPCNGHTHSYSLAPFQTKICEEAKLPCTSPKLARMIDKQKKEQDMSSYASVTAINADTTEKDQRKYLERRLWDVMYTIKVGLKKQFGLNDDEAPQTAEDFITRIKDGKYTVDADKMKKEAWSTYDLVRYIRWRDPSVVEDMDGYKAARAALDAEVTRVTDIIKIKTPAEGLEALQAFEGWTYTA